MMKFVKISTKYTESQLDEIYDKLNPTERENIDKYYKNYDYETYTDSDGYQCMFMSIHDNYLVDLLDLYKRISMRVNCEDFTKEALYDTIDFTNLPITDTEKSLLIYTAKVFRELNLDLDIVLEKIHEMGEYSLSKEDRLVLLNF